MNQGITIERQFHKGRGRGGRKQTQSGNLQPLPSAMVPRVARLMALAIRFDQLIRDGVVADQAELARLSHVSRTRLSQIMNLLNLAPDIQEGILLAKPVAAGLHRVCERQLRPIAATPSWETQQFMWRRLRETLVDPIGKVCV